jgi:hypothetical protein
MLLTFRRNTWCYVPEGNTLRSHCCESCTSISVVTTYSMTRFPSIQVSPWHSFSYMIGVSWDFVYEVTYLQLIFAATQFRIFFFLFDVWKHKGWNILSHVGGLCMTYRLVVDWMIGYIDTLYIQLGTTGNSALSPVYTLYSSPLHMHWVSQSSLFISWQRIYNSLTVTSNHAWSLLVTVWFLSCHFISIILDCHLQNSTHFLTTINCSHGTSCYIALGRTPWKTPS